MIDREKVINVVESLFENWIDRNEKMRPLAVENMRLLEADALAMLKEQEAVEPEVEVLNEIDRLYRCPKCHKCFFYEKQKYCDQCGQKVKWE